MVLQFIERGKGEKCLLNMPMQMWSGWVLGYTNLEFQSEVRTEDRDERIIRIWKVCSHTGRTKSTRKQVPMKQVLSAKQFNIGWT